MLENYPATAKRKAALIGTGSILVTAVVIGSNMHERQQDVPQTSRSTSPSPTESPIANPTIEPRPSVAPTPGKTALVHYVKTSEPRQATPEASPTPTSTVIYDDLRPTGTPTPETTPTEDPCLLPPPLPCV